MMVKLFIHDRKYIIDFSITQFKKLINKVACMVISAVSNNTFLKESVNYW